MALEPPNFYEFKVYCTVLVERSEFGIWYDSYDLTISRSII